MVELQLLVPQALVDSVGDVLGDALEALSVSVEDADAGTDEEQALFGEPGMAPPGPGWQRSALRALFQERATAEAAAALLLAQDWAAGVQLLGVAEVPEQDWVRLTQAQFTPVRITEHFFVVPSWHAPPPEATRVLRLDPGVAFGTGTHPTTRMCLRWIADHGDVAPGWARVLDYGCGSGILAIAAALHGAPQVDAVDIDPAAVAATRSNARDNGIPLREDAGDGAGAAAGAGLLAGLPERAQGRYDVVLANILATPLKLLAPLLAGHLAPGGALVLAGILERQTAELQAAYAPHLALEVLDAEDGWVLLGGRRAAP